MLDSQQHKHSSILNCTGWKINVRNSFGTLCDFSYRLLIGFSEAKRAKVNFSQPRDTISRAVELRFSFFFHNATHDTQRLNMLLSATTLTYWGAVQLLHLYNFDMLELAKESKEMLRVRKQCFPIPLKPTTRNMRITHARQICAFAFKNMFRHEEGYQATQQRVFTPFSTPKIENLDSV